MDYTIKQVADISGVSTRTLRYYDEIGLLPPERTTENGYRVYTSQTIDRLQQILFYRSLDFSLRTIKELLDQPTFNTLHALVEQRAALLQKKEQIDTLLTTIDKTISYQKGEKEMTEKEKFEGFKQQELQKNEAVFGAELREIYGEKTMTQANQKWLDLTADDYEKWQQLEQTILRELTALLNTPSQELDGKAARQLFEHHKEWLSYTWPTYSKEAHQGLGEMYVHDPRFRSYYETQAGTGAAERLNQVIQTFAK